MIAGEKLLRKNEVDRAINAFHAAAKQAPLNPVPHYNLACAYSLKNMPTEALFHLNKALENGYSNLQNLQNDPDLHNLREYEGYKSFRANNYSLK